MPLERAKFRGDESPHRFREVLHHLKQEGCNLLVTGEVTTAVTARATQTLVGAADAERKRVLALSDGDRSPQRRLPPSVDLGGPNTWIITRRAHKRSVPKPVERAADTELPTTDEGRTALDRVREEIGVAVEYFDDVADGLDPAELRLSVESLECLEHGHGREELVRFVQRVTAIVRDVSGMAHYHLPVTDDADLVEQVSPLFDARIELRKREGLPTEQRWHIPDYDRTTEWVRL